jgi:hypothetical protein
MPLSINYTTPNTGAVAEYHVVAAMNLDQFQNTTTALVFSYLNVDSKAAGKFNMYQQQIQLDGLPPAGQTALDFTEAALVESAPTMLPTNTPANRYAFAGASIVA